MPVIVGSLMQPEREILSGWKEIANYLGKGVRTVQRYEHDFNLPIRRPTSLSPGSVIATKSELNAWTLACSIRESSHETPIMTVSRGAAIEELNKSIDQMHRLRDEIRERRVELIFSIDRLHRSLRTPKG
jgi:hypothetical protein